MSTDAPGERPADGRGPSGSEWDGAAYDRLSGPQARWGRAVLDRLALGGSETVLDAGCGSGRVTEALLDRLPAGRVVALDASRSMLAEARVRLASRQDRVRYVEADLLELEHGALGEDQPVDAVLSTATFHWVTDHDRLFANLAAVMRPGGQLVAQCGAEGNIENVLAAVRSLGVERAGTWLYAAPAETATRLGRAGFTDVQVWTNPEPTPFPSHVALADFLETVCLREHLAMLPPGDRRPFAEQVASEMPEPVIDYVRLNIVARRGVVVPGQPAGL
jgi:trans-aconitate 2-methyltransferase